MEHFSDLKLETQERRLKVFFFHYFLYFHSLFLVIFMSIMRKVMCGIMAPSNGARDARQLRMKKKFSVFFIKIRWENIVGIFRWMEMTKKR
jgi:hypothetical protein